ncbi:MAG: hypothetical protein M3Y49_20745 [Actinomycetota bacterium]|nr:hypothetical protein [Actinomycetota bacterium]
MIFLTTTAAALLWVAAINRMIVSMRGPAALWRWSFTFAVLALAIGSTLLAIGVTRLDGELHIVNIGVLLMQLAIVTAAGAVSVYVLTLRSDRVHPMHVAAAIVLCVLVLGTEITAWVLAPFHDRELPDIALTALTSASVTYFFALYAYLAAVLVLTAYWCVQELRATHGQRGSVRPGLRIIGIATGSSAIEFAGRLFRILVHAATGQKLDILAAVLRILETFSVTGVAVGTVLFLLGPHIDEWIRNRQLIRELGPLATRIRQIYPAVELAEVHLARQPGSIRAQRLIIEINDGLRLLPVGTELTHLSAVEIAKALSKQQHPETGLTAHELLRSLSPEAEQQILLDIAACYSGAGS